MSVLSLCRDYVTHFQSLLMLQLPNPLLGWILRISAEVRNSFLLDVSVELLFAAAGPMVAVKRGLDQRSHDAAHTGLIRAAVSLAIMLHSQPETVNAISKLLVIFIKQGVL